MQAFYYIHTDYMGSWLAITDNSGSLKNHYNYDAWGRRRDPVTWKLCPINPASASIGGSMLAMQPRFDRGYTGHEQMAGFALINMNGRMYDPYLQRFLSPDNEIQAPGDAQSYNRYTYCMNNPLMYTDPSGYTWFTQLGNWLGSTGRTIAEVAVGIGVGIAVTALTGGLDLITVGVLCGMAAGASSGALSTAFSGGNFNDYLNAITQGATIGGLTGFATSAAMYGISAGWQALGNIEDESDVSSIDQPIRIGRGTSLWGKLYYFVNNIGKGAANVSILGTTSGALTSDELSSALASLGTRAASGLNMNLVHRAATVIDNSQYLEYNATFQNAYNTTGTLTLHNSSGETTGTWNATSCAGNLKSCSIDRGDWTLASEDPDFKFSPKNPDTSPYFNYNENIGFKFRFLNQFGRTGVLIHPTPTFGTRGCIGLLSQGINGNSDDALCNFEQNIHNYLQTNNRIEVRVSISN